MYCLFDKGIHFWRVFSVVNKTKPFLFRMELTINLASDKWYAAIKNGDHIDIVKNKGREAFNAFARYSDSVVGIDSSKDSSFSKKSLVYPLYYLCADSDDAVFKKMKGYQPIGMRVSADGHLEYETDEHSVSAKDVLECLLKNIMKQVENIQVLVLIVPDFFDQPKRETLIDIVNSIIQHNCPSIKLVKLVNHSSAAVGWLTKELNRNTAKVVTLRFESGVFEIGVFKDATSLSATPIVSLSDDSVCGIDFMTNAYEDFIDAKSKDHDYDKGKKSHNWMEFRNHILNVDYYEDSDDGPDDDPDVRDRDNNLISYKHSYTIGASDAIQKEIQNSIEMCLMLAGLNPSDITYIVSTGPWSEKDKAYIKMEEIVKKVFPNQRNVFRRVGDKDLCKSVSGVFSDSNAVNIKQALQTSWGIRYKDQTLLLLDRFTVYPTEIQKTFSFIPSKDDCNPTLFLYMVSMNSNKRVDIQHYRDINLSPTPGDQKKCRVDVRVDENGIVSISFI